MTVPTWARRVFGWFRRRPKAPSAPADEWGEVVEVDLAELRARREREREDRPRWIDKRNDIKRWS